MDRVDPRDLMADAYRMRELSAAECRTIFLDWLLALPDGADAQEAVRVLLERYGRGNPAHPMTDVLDHALSVPVETARRRGGRGARRR